VAREGFPFIAIGAGAALLSLLMGWCGLFWTFLALTGWVVWFFRNPRRCVPEGDRWVVAPADGRVLRVVQGDADTPVRVDIFMNVFNVHVNRLPVAGRVERVAYTPGRFVNASFDKASEHNERNAVTVVTDTGHTVRFVQIAGLVARRIVCWLEVGETVRAGDIFGLIRFGSRVDVHLPPGTRVWVRPGQRTMAGETVLGRLP